MDEKELAYINHYKDLLGKKIKQAELKKILDKNYIPKDDIEKKVYKAYSEEIKAIRLLNNSSETKNFTKKKPCHLFITINPNECTVEDIKIIIDIIFKIKYITVCSYVIEQRGFNDETKGNGKHIHMIVDYDSIYKHLKDHKPPSYIAKNIYTKIKQYISGYNKIKITKIFNIKGKEEVEKYMQGYKKDDKLEKVKINKIWRKENNIKEYYIINGDFKIIKDNREKIEHCYLIDGKYLEVIIDGQKKIIEL